METARFDAIARGIARMTTRRGMLTALIGGAFGIAAVNAGAADLSTDAKKGEGARCDEDQDCGRGLICKKSKKDGKNRRECRYEDGCGQRDDFCEETADCCKKLKCDRQRNRCVK